MKILVEKQELCKQLFGELQVKGHLDVYVTFNYSFSRVKMFCF